MNESLIHETVRRTLAGTIAFPDVVAALQQAGVEAYSVDYVSRRQICYAPEGGTTTVVLDLGALPAIAAEFDAAAVQAAILDSQRHGQSYRDFTHRVMAAGVRGYHAFLRGRRVTYFGRQGDQHTEWFPGANPQLAPPPESAKP